MTVFEFPGKYSQDQISELMIPGAALITRHAIYFVLSRNAGMAVFLTVTQFFVQIQSLQLDHSMLSLFSAVAVFIVQ